MGPLLLLVFFEVYLVKRFGGSPGKLIMGLRILKTDGMSVTCRQSILRAGPDLIFELLTCIAFASVYSRFVEAERISSAMPNLVAIGPVWYGVVSVVQNIWVWSELLVLLTNRKRRALHDFIAGTVVVIVSEPGFRRQAAVSPPLVELPKL